jgi:hypothetical protein
MIYFLALLPATALTIAGYFVLFLSNRSEGSFRTFGKYLGFWAFTLAALIVLGAIFAAAHGRHRHHCPMMGAPGMYGHMHPGTGEPGGPENGAPPPPPGAPNPAPPAAPSPH